MTKKLFNQRSTMTKERALQSLEALAIILVCAQSAEIALFDLDSNFKSPNVHNRIRQMKDNSKFIMDYVRNMPVLKDVDIERVEEIGSHLYVTIKTLCQFQPEDIEAYNQVLGRLVAEAVEAQKEVIA